MRDADRDNTRGAAVMRGRWVRVRALPGRAERRVLHAEADSAAEALIFPPDGGQARASGRNRPNVPCSDIADVGSAEFNVCLWRRQSTVLLSQRDRSICSWWPAPLAVAEGASATDPADRPERRCEAISSAARRTWRIRKLVGGRSARTTATPRSPDPLPSARLRRRWRPGWPRSRPPAAPRAAHRRGDPNATLSG